MTSISSPRPGAYRTDEQRADEPSVGSLCSGYGGLDLGLALALGVPLRHAWHVENDAAPSKILAARFPGVPNLGDLKTLDHAALEPVDWLTAGYPCQPFSSAGKRLGAADARHLWPYVADTIGALRPRNVLLENVRGHVRRGLDSVLADLAHLGYDASWGVVRASDAGAPHRRERIFIVAQDADVAARGERWEPTPGQAPIGWARADAGGRGGAPIADTDRGRLTEQPEPDGGTHGHRLQAPQWDDALRCGRVAPNTDDWLLGDVSRGVAGATASGERCDEGSRRGSADRGRGDTSWGIYGQAVRCWERATGRPAPWATEPRGRGGAERLSPRFVEWMMGLPAGWVTDVDISVNEQLKALGNGCVPQQAALAVRVLLGLPSVSEVAA